MTRVRVRLGRPQSERVRTLVCGTVGLVAGVLLHAGWGVWELSVTGGWIAAAAALVAWVWAETASLGAGETATLARIADDSRASSRAVTIVACVASLVAVVATLHRANRTAGAMGDVLTGCALATVALSWAVIQSHFTLRYAHLHYGRSPACGIQFPGTEAPAFRDFAYVAFGVGMCFQVADTNIETGEMRAAVLSHALLSYLFGVAIIGATINVVAGLI